MKIARVEIQHITTIQHMYEKFLEVLIHYTLGLVALCRRTEGEIQLMHKLMAKLGEHLYRMND